MPDTPPTTTPDTAAGPLGDMDAVAAHLLQMAREFGAADPVGAAVRAVVAAELASGGLFAEEYARLAEALADQIVATTEWCERCGKPGKIDPDCGLCPACTRNNDDRVTL